jgi:hypothetical protein
MIDALGRDVKTPGRRSKRVDVAAGDLQSADMFLRAIIAFLPEPLPLMQACLGAMSVAIPHIAAPCSSS